MRLFIADDEFLVLEGIERMLREINVECEVVGCSDDGESAWEMIQECRPDLLITDIRMPGLSGLELIQRCKQAYSHMLYIIISGYQEFAYAQQAIGLGVIAYIDKPITYGKLQTALMTAEDAYYKNRWRNTNNEFFMHKCDALVRLACEKKVDELRRTYEEVKQQVHREQWELNDYRRYMYMLTMFLTGAYYEKLEPEAVERHYPSYKNVYMLYSTEEIDEYADVIVHNLIDKIERLSSGTIHKTIQELMEYIRDNYASDISLNSLAQMAHISPVYLSTLFKEETGISYIKYVTELRLGKAKELLRSGEYLVTEVSEKVGYHNYRYFCDMFKKSTGMTPNEYKGTVRRGHETS